MKQPLAMRSPDDPADGLPDAGWEDPPPVPPAPTPPVPAIPPRPLDWPPGEGAGPPGSVAGCRNGLAVLGLER